MSEDNEQIEATVVFVDLVAFSALTDVHGDLAGADAAEAIERSARSRAQPHATFVKAAGDGVLLQSAEPAHGLAVAGAVVEDVHDLGLDARAGVHHGSVVVRNDDIYGSTVNLASRLAALAPPGTVLVTRLVAFAAARTRFAVSPQGPAAVKGFLDPIETFLVDPCTHDGAWVIDPVCGMRLAAAAARRGSEPAEPGRGFCSTRCEALYARDPGRYGPG